MLDKSNLLMRKCYVLNLQNIFITFYSILRALIVDIPPVARLDVENFACDWKTAIRDAQPNKIFVSNFVFQRLLDKWFVVQVESINDYAFLANDLYFIHVELLIYDK